MIPANPYTPPQFMTTSLPTLPPLHDELVKNIHKHVDERLDEVMAGGDKKLSKEFEKYISNMMSSSDDLIKKLAKHVEKHFEHHEGKEDVPHRYKESPIHALYHKIHCYQKKIHEGTSIMDVEKEVYEHHPDLSHNEKRVFAALLRADGPYTLSSMIGISYHDFNELMEKIGERFVEED